MLYTIFSLSWKTLYSLLYSSFSQPDLCTVSIVLPFPGWHIVPYIQYVAFKEWLLSLSNMDLRCLNLSMVWKPISKVKTFEKYPTVETYHSLVIHSIYWKIFACSPCFDNYEYGCRNYAQDFVGILNFQLL